MSSAPIGTASHQVGGYQEFTPPPDLADAVEAVWIHQAPDVLVATHRVVPDAAVSLCFMGLRAPNGLAGDARLRIIGPVSRAHAFAPPCGHRMESVRIKLEWCRPLLGVAPSEHIDDEPLYADVDPTSPCRWRRGCRARQRQHTCSACWWTFSARGAPTLLCVL